MTKKLEELPNKDVIPSGFTSVKEYIESLGLYLTVTHLRSHVQIVSVIDDILLFNHKETIHKHIVKKDKEIPLHRLYIDISSAKKLTEDAFNTGVKLKLDNYGGTTIVKIFRKGDKIKDKASPHCVTVSSCHLSDQYNKAVGVEMALRHGMSDPNCIPAFLNYIQNINK